MQNRTKMSGSTKPSQPLMSVKEEIKEEEFDDFLQEYLSGNQKVEEKPGLKHDCKTESERSPTLACKEEKSSLMEIKEENESDLRDYDRNDSPTSKLQIILYHEKILCHVLFIFTFFINTWILVNGFNLCFTQ